MFGAPTIVYLIGPPAVGKLTIGRHLVSANTTEDAKVVLLDNHHFNDPVLEAIGADGTTTLPSEVWGYASRVRAAVIDAVEALAPPRWSFVFTNYLSDSPRSQATFDRLVHLAERRDSALIPV